MRRLIAVEYVSLDGVIQAPGHAAEDLSGGFRHGGWTADWMSEHHVYMSDRFRRAGAFLFGRLTYEIWAGYWPAVTDPDDAIARALNTRPKYVASRTLTACEWDGTELIRGDVPTAVGALKAQDGADIYLFGSSGLARTLIGHNLIDVYDLWIHPVVLGSGKRLFDQASPRHGFELVDAQVTRGGLIAARYEHSHIPASAEAQLSGRPNR